MIKYLFSIILMCYFSGQLLSQKNNSYYFNIGLLNSDIHGTNAERERENSGGLKANSPKTGFILSLGRIDEIWNNIHIDYSLNYQERLPLESFKFYATGNSPNIILTNAPTSPQSEFWDKEISQRLPNFKYLHLEIVPTYNFGNKLHGQVGVGIFYGRLLNSNKLDFDQSDFPQFTAIFDSGVSYTTDQYIQNDFGWMPKCRVAYNIKNNLSLSLSAKGYFSLNALISNNLDFNNWGRSTNTNWQVFSAGIDIIYSLSQGNEW